MSGKGPLRNVFTSAAEVHKEMLAKPATGLIGCSIALSLMLAIYGSSYSSASTNSYEITLNLTAIANYESTVQHVEVDIVDNTGAVRASRVLNSHMPQQTLVLPEGAYLFRVKGFDNDSTTRTWLAYNEVSQTIIAETVIDLPLYGFSYGTLATLQQTDNSSTMTTSAAAMIVDFCDFAEHKQQTDCIYENLDAMSTRLDELSSTLVMLNTKLDGLAQRVDDPASKHV
ncbi:MAG: hypothetical protein AAF267_23505 [Deinococcota bacterium]